MQHFSQHRRPAVHLQSRDGRQQHQQPELWHERKRKRFLSDTAVSADVASTADATAKIVALASAATARRAGAGRNPKEQGDGAPEADSSTRGRTG